MATTHREPHNGIETAILHELRLLPRWAQEAYDAVCGDRLHFHIRLQSISQTTFIDISAALPIIVGARTVGQLFDPAAKRLRQGPGGPPDVVFPLQA
jgi:hypothetical protein